jgi:D-erythrulose 4-phosphate isomerase
MKLDTAMKTAVGADSSGEPLLRVILEFRPRDGRVVLYPEIAARVALKVLPGEYERGILFWGTGIGMCISANKAGVHAGLTDDIYSAELARESNNTAITRVIGPELPNCIADTWLRCEFRPSSHCVRNGAALDALDERFVRKQAPRVA